MTCFQLLVLVVGLTGWSAAFASPNEGTKVWDTQLWNISQTSKCDDADTSTNYVLCFVSTATQVDAEAACREICKDHFDPEDGHDRCPKGYRCSCTATKAEPGPCSCSDSTRTLEKGC